MNKYEVMYVIDTTIEDSERAALMSRAEELVKVNGGIVDRVDEWGKRRLAYAINYKTEGYYVLMYIQAPSDLPRELERNFKNIDTILRSLVVRYEGELPAKREPLKPYQPREAAFEETAEEEKTEVPAEETESAEEAAPAESEAPATEAE